MPFFESPNPSPALSDAGGPSGTSSPRVELDPVDRLLREEAEVVEDSYTNMNEVLPGLWIGDIVAASDGEALKAQGITRVVSVLRGSVPLTDGVTSQSIPVDDDSSADLLAHLPAAVDYIRDALSDDVEGGVLVHCQAGMSRSATIVAAYLMSEHELSVEDALTIIRRARRCIQPSDTFLSQLEIFGAAKYRVSNKDQVTREFYRDRVVTEVLNGDGSAITSTHFAQYPSTPRRGSVSGSGASTPSTAYRRRKLRCGSCRRELALREHVLHATGTPTGGTPPLSFTSIFQPSPKVSRSPSITSVSTSPIASSPLAMTSSTIVGSPSISQSPSPPPPTGHCVPNGPPDSHPPPRTIPATLARARTKSMLAALSASLLSVTTTPDPHDSSPFHSDDDEDDGDEKKEDPLPLPLAAPLQISTNVTPDVAGTDSHTDSPLHRRLSMSRLTLGPKSSLPPSVAGSPIGSRRPSFTSAATKTSLPPPILTNTTCSGYFLEPMGWMDSSIASGQLAGKILCPNERCKAKIGSFDWAGSKCGCKEWITPAFCLHRAKVDDIAF